MIQKKKKKSHRETYVRLSTTTTDKKMVPGLDVGHFFYPCRNKNNYTERFPWAVCHHCRPVFALGNPEERIYLMSGSQELSKPVAQGLLSSMAME